MVNLNFLELSGGGELTSLPDTLGTLQNLTTLLLKANIASVFFHCCQVPSRLFSLSSQKIRPLEKKLGCKSLIEENLTRVEISRLINSVAPPPALPRQLKKYLQN